MRAAQTRAGGRHVAGERGSEQYASDAGPTLKQKWSPALIYRLSVRSLVSLASWQGITVRELFERYG
jgi:hypothetical protein